MAKMRLAFTPEGNDLAFYLMGGDGPLEPDLRFATMSARVAVERPDLEARYVALCKDIAAYVLKEVFDAEVVAFGPREEESPERN